MNWQTQSRAGLQDAEVLLVAETEGAQELDRVWISIWVRIWGGDPDSRRAGSFVGRAPREEIAAFNKRIFWHKNSPAFVSGSNQRLCNECFYNECE